MLNLSAKKGYEEKGDDFKFKNRGMMAYIGSSEALVDMSSVHEMAKQSGRLSWLLWRSAYFSMSMNIRNRMLIAYHW
jgi:NADH dehydrogenase FAD-containing subunit